MLKNNGFHNRHSPFSRPFSPASFFANGEQGWWYDPSDYTTLFQDSAGTTPVTAVEQPVGLQLDLSQGLVLGSELVTPEANRDFSSDTGYWTKGTDWTISGGVASRPSSATSSSLTKSGLLTAGVWYEITFTATVTGTLIVYAGTSSSQGFDTGTYTNKKTRLLCAGTPNFIFQASGAASSVTIDNISVKALPGNHRFQSTSANRPVVSARVNLLTKTEQFDDAVWAKNNATVAANGSAWRITDATVIASANIQQFVTVVANTPHTFQVEFDKQASGFFALAVGNFFCYVNHATLATFNETMFAGVSPSSSVTLVSGTRYRVTCTVTLASASNNVKIFAAVGVMSGDVNSATNVLATGFLDVYQADFRVSNIGVGLPAYQRVNTSTDYDSTGFPVYIKPNGSNQFMQTNSINFTATDKMTVWQGVRKLSDVARGMLMELSASVGANSGTFLFSAPESAAANYGFGARGSMLVSPAATSPSYASPITNVLSGISSISDDVAVLRVNGTQAASQTGDIGTGNFGTYPAYFYMRAGTSLPFNGHDYGSIARGAASTAAQITDGETYINSKTKAF